MHEVSKDEMPASKPRLRSLSLFVGTGACNAHCPHCAGVQHRRYAPKQDGIIDEKLISQTLLDCYAQGARSLSLSSGGEPTLSPVSVTKTLEIVHRCKDAGVMYSSVNLYSNGIRIGEEKAFSDRYLPQWKSLGLTTVYVTVHDIDEKKNAKAYGVTSYPPLETVISRIHDAGLLMRANLVLSRKTIGTLEDFVWMVDGLNALGADRTAAWPVRGDDDRIDYNLSPPTSELGRISAWMASSGIVHNVTLSGEHTRALYETGQKLTLFPDGMLSSDWCNDGR